MHHSDRGTVCASVLQVPGSLNRQGCDDASCATAAHGAADGPDGAHLDGHMVLVVCPTLCTKYPYTCDTVGEVTAAVEEKLVQRNPSELSWSKLSRAMAGLEQVAAAAGAIAAH